MTKKLLAVFSLLSITALLMIAFTLPPTADSRAKIAPFLQTQFRRGGEQQFFVILANQADLSPARRLPDKTAKGEYVFDRLRQTAQNGQAALTDWLDQRGITYQSFYIVNALLVTGSESLALQIAARPDVLRLEANPTIHADLPAPQPAQPRTIAAVEPGVTYIHAPQVWDLGFTGQGIVIGGQDTGYQWNHPALINQYRGWNGTTADHNYNWHDSIHTANNDCPANSPAPCDDYGHGTHTMGTAVGSDGYANRIGVAPGARWIGCRNMNDGRGTPATYLECFEFFLAPYPLTGTVEMGRPDLAPDVTVNSWTCPTSEGCSALTLQAAVEAQRAAGIMTVAAAGNEGTGSSCSTINSPPGIYEATYTVGALQTGSDSLASFSNTGPVTVDGSNRPKPDLSAPGTNTRSAYPGGGYTSMSGTSMATPHVAGAVALLWSAIPALTNAITATEAYLNAAAVPISATLPCGTAVLPNNQFGYGRLDILATVQRALSDYQLDPAAAFTHTTPVYLNQPVTFTNLSSGTLPITFTWNFGDDSLSLAGTLTLPVQHTYTQTGRFTVTLTAANPVGQSAATHTVTVSQIFDVYLPIVLK